MSYPTDFNDTVVYNGVDLYVPKDCSCTVMEDSRVFLFGEFYLNGQPIMTGSGVASGSEVNVGPTQPVDPGITLWFDTSTGYGELKAKVGGSWKTVEDPADDALQNEVYVGGVEPVGGNYELWVDTATDIPPSTASYASAGNALGIVAVGSVSTIMDVAVKTQITSNIPFTPIVGRRYRISISIRSTYSTSGAAYANVYLRDGTTDMPGPGPSPTIVAGMWDTMAYNWIIAGDNISRSYNVALLASNLDVYGDGDSHFYIEDVGPNTSPALPIPETPPAWTPLPLSGTWLNFSTATHTNASYRKIGDVVYLRGLIANATSISTTNQISTLPVGFRPVLNVLTIVGGTVGAGIYSALRVDIGPTGVINYAPYTNGTIGLLALDTVSFSVTP